MPRYKITIEVILDDARHELRHLHRLG